jgi:integrase
MRLSITVTSNLSDVIGSSVHRSVYAMELAPSRLPAHRPLRGIRRDAVRAQMTCELLAPMPQRRLADIEPHTLLAHRLHNNVHVRMRPIGMQRKGVAMRRRWLKGVPKIRMLKELRRRVRFLRREEADRLIDALPTHMTIVEFALATGCRAGEILGLERSCVDLVPTCWVMIRPDGQNRQERVEWRKWAIGVK